MSPSLIFDEFVFSIVATFKDIPDEISFVDFLALFEDAHVGEFVQFFFGFLPLGVALEVDLVSIHLVFWQAGEADGAFHDVG